MKTKIAFIIMILLSIILFANNSNRSKPIDLNRINSVDLTGANVVYIEQSNNPQLKIDGEGQEDLDIYVKGNTLYIKNKKNTFSLANIIKIKPTKNVIITLSLKEINKISANGAVVVENSNPIEGDQLIMELNGVGSIELTKLNYNFIAASVDGTGAIELDGHSNSLELYLKGIGSINTENLKTYNCVARNYGIGAITLYAENELDASLKGLGLIEYYGKPKLKKSISGLGSIVAGD
ncbi:MAG: DUF2807 domain-containing protein [Candidatus Cloacimonadales bacterium]|jgi:hypothetical protein|nr:DUF2807 domain-containing protein [Candidatus Cloacimonadota bacterium]MDD2650225.1 DUF2807 domain-containing protein [Candidatus Cloacimonadota bacterium]MDD3501548.1 DUF2807 domain-containing protein [Candidatus Cloacimonadota bacterium]MDX9978000.1 DUF2807 domain-containing protein [Candidatus Cloacimonadales bacterium]